MSELNWQHQDATEKQIETIFKLFGRLGWPVKSFRLTKQQASDEIQSALNEMASRHSMFGCLMPYFEDENDRPEFDCIPDCFS